MKVKTIILSLSEYYVFKQLANAARELFTYRQHGIDIAVDCSETFCNSYGY